MLRQSWGAWMSHSVRPVGPAWLQYAWTLLFSCGVAAAFTVVGFLAFADGEGAWRNWAGWAEWYLNYLVVSLAIGFSIHLLFDAAKALIGTARIARFTKWQRSLYFSVIPFGGLFIGLALGSILVGHPVRHWAGARDANSVAGSVLLAQLAWFVISQYFFARQRRMVAERQAAQAQLRLLQAQMEPHFLFNTLANVVGLMESDTPRAKRMLESFTDYLRASLGSLRNDAHTLGGELALVEAYLSVVKVRMEERLHYRIDVADALRTLPLPTLSLQPLVENAVVHGLEPKIEGGHVSITARLDAGRLVLSVTDDGLSLDPPRRPAQQRGSGTALENIRERLRQVQRGELTIEPATPHGVCATLTLPI